MGQSSTVIVSTLPTIVTKLYYSQPVDHSSCLQIDTGHFEMALPNQNLTEKSK